MESDEENVENNGAVLNIAEIIRNMVTSAASAEIGALFINTRQAFPAFNLLQEMGHKQPATPTQTDNTTALGFVTKNLNPKATKSEDMNYWYLRDKKTKSSSTIIETRGSTTMVTTKQNTIVQPITNKRGPVTSLLEMCWTHSEGDRANLCTHLELARGCARHLRQGLRYHLGLS